MDNQYGPTYTARNSERLGSQAAQKFLAKHSNPSITKRAADKAAAINHARALRMSARMDESFDADISGDAFRSGINSMKLRLLSIREAANEILLHGADTDMRGLIHGARMFQAITVEQYRLLLQLRDSAYNCRIKELVK